MKELLELIEENYALPIEQLAVMLNKPAAEVAAQIKRLEAEKVIVKYQALINWEKAGINNVTAMIVIRVTPQREVGFDAIAERIYRFPEVRSLYLMSGGFDLLAMVQGQDLKTVAHFVATKLAPIDGVVSTTTHFMLKRYKEAGVILEDREQDRRLVISP